MQLTNTIGYLLCERQHARYLEKWKWKKVLVAQLCPDSFWPPGLLCPWSSPGKNTGVDCHSLLRGSFRPRDWTWASCTEGSYLGFSINMRDMSLKSSAAVGRPTLAAAVAGSCPSSAFQLGCPQGGLPVCWHPSYVLGVTCSYCCFSSWLDFRAIRRAGRVYGSWYQHCLSQYP